jgi:hypothetical protein
VSQDTFARIMGLAAVVFLIYALVLGLEAVLGRELLPGPGVYGREVSESVPRVSVGGEVERGSDRGAAREGRKRLGPAARPKRAGVTRDGRFSIQDAGDLGGQASTSVEAVVAEGLRSAERLARSGSHVPELGRLERLGQEQPLGVLGE